MPERPLDPDLFDEQEISAILKRAAEIQTSDGSSEVFGLSLSELQQLAKDVGFDPQAIAIAAGEVRRIKKEDGVNFWGGPLSLTQTCISEGEIDEATWETMVSAIRQAFNDTGTVSSRGQVREWKHSGASNVQAHVSATPRDGQTRIEVFWHEPVMVAPAYVPALVLGLIMIPVVFEELALVSLLGLGLYLSILGVLFLLARWVLSRMAAKEKRKVRSLLTTLEQLTSRSSPQQAEQIATARLAEGTAKATSLLQENEVLAAQDEVSPPTRLSSRS